MKTPPLVVVSSRSDAPPGEGRFVTADQFLAGEGDVLAEGQTVVNLCRSWRYLSKGYYVSLLADARGQSPIPSVDTMEALGHPETVFRRLHEAGVPTVDVVEMRGRRRSLPDTIVAVDARNKKVTPLIREYVRDSFAYRPARDAEVADFVAFLGYCEDKRFRKIAAGVYRQFPVPALRVRLLRESRRWNVIEVLPVRVGELTRGEREALARALAARGASKPPAGDAKEGGETLAVAVLWDEQDPRAASAEDTLERMRQVGARMNVSVHVIDSGDLARIGDYDALFIRSITGIDQPSFRFALRAEALGIPVIDDSRSIIRCGNKVFLHELLTREGVPVPRTVIATREMPFPELEAALGLPFVVKLPDGSFGTAVAKVTSADDYAKRAGAFFESSPLLIAQTYTPTEFDWRVVVLEGRVLFACKYHMARGHWQIVATSQRGLRNGRVEAVPRERVPRDVLKVATRASQLMGEGLYGVDIKDTPDGAVVIEVNDNPNMDVGYEDAAEGDAVYEEILGALVRRVKKAVAPPPERRPPAVDTDALRAPIGKPPPERSRAYRRYEVCGLELEYPIVDRDLQPVSLVESTLGALAGHPASNVTLGVIGFSNEIFDHVIELKTEVPLRSLAQSEELLVEGVRRVSALLAERYQARLFPTGMHPWFDPKAARLWQRSNRRIYETYERLFDIYTHGWANVQASHVNLPLGREESDAVAMMNAAVLLVPYLPALAASTPMYDRAIGPAVDNRLAYILQHQSRVPESCGQLVPEYIDSLRAYRRDVLAPMFAAVGKLADADPLRHDFFNARAAVFKLSRDSMEVRVLDTQECVKRDCAIAAFVRAALRELADRIEDGLPLPEHAVLVEDFHACVREGTAAHVRAPHLEGATNAREALRVLVDLARDRMRADEAGYLALLERTVEQGNLSERMLRVLRRTSTAGELERCAKRIYIRLSECLLDNEPWDGTI